MEVFPLKLTLLSFLYLTPEVTLDQTAMASGTVRNGTKNKALVVSNGSSGAKVQEQVDIQMVFLYHFISLLYGRSLAALNWTKAWSSLSKSWYSVAVLQDVTSTRD